MKTPVFTLVGMAIFTLAATPAFSDEQTYVISGNLINYDSSGVSMRSGFFAIELTVLAPEVCETIECKKTEKKKGLFDNVIDSIVTTIYDDDMNVIATYENPDLLSTPDLVTNNNYIQSINMPSGGSYPDELHVQYNGNLDSVESSLNLDWTDYSAEMLQSRKFPDLLQADGYPGVWHGSDAGVSDGATKKSGGKKKFDWRGKGEITSVGLKIIDSDGDGIPDDQDACIYSDLSATVLIGDIDTGAVNTLFPDGCTIADNLDAIVFDVTNHGQIASSITHYTNELKAAGVISGKDKGKIQSAVAKTY